MSRPTVLLCTMLALGVGLVLGSSLKSRGAQTLVGLLLAIFAAFALGSRALR